MKNATELKAELIEKFPVGSSRISVCKFLTDNHIGHSYLENERKIYAIIPGIGRYLLIYETSLLIRIQFNEDDGLQNIEFELEYTGL